MKKSLYWFGSLGLAVILVLGTTVYDTRADRENHAERKKSPLRGTWSFSQFTPVSGFGTSGQILASQAGTLIMNDDNSFTGHGVIDTPLPIPNPTFEIDFHGSCTFRQGDAKNGVDCKIDVPTFNLSDVGRFCVVMGGRGECFDEFRCVDTNEPGNVTLVEFKRQNPGSCQ